jgi:hypothetical protein
MYDNSLIGFFGFGRNPAFDQASSSPPNAAYGSTHRRCRLLHHRRPAPAQRAACR